MFWENVKKERVLRDVLWENVKKERVLRDVLWENAENWNDEEISFVSQVDQVSVAVLKVTLVKIETLRQTISDLYLFGVEVFQKGKKGLTLSS